RCDARLHRRSLRAKGRRKVCRWGEQRERLHPAGREYCHFHRQFELRDQLRREGHEAARCLANEARRMNQAQMSRGLAMQHHFKAAMRHWLCQFGFGRERDTAGTAAVEFAVLSSVLVLLMVATMDLGMGFYRGIQVRNAAQAGAAYAMAK